MKKIIKWGIFSIFCLLAGGVIWNAVVGYTPSDNGQWEEKTALEDMHDECEMSKIDCSDLRVTERYPPREGEACKFPREAKPQCKKTKGFWGFVVRLKTGEKYLIAVLPFGSTPVFVGRYSEISLLETK